MIKFFVLLVAVALSQHANALSVFSCEPEWAALVLELAGEETQITIATSAFQDPHRLQARPSLISAMRKADMVVCTGADLEIGWLPLLMRRAGNSSIQTGNPGNFMAADFVRRLEIPKSIDRSQGDVHPQGNPHIHLHPRNILKVAAALAKRLAVVDSANEAVYRSRFDDFKQRWEDATLGWDERAQKLEGLRLASHHKSFSYLANWLDLDIVATLESKPGVPPSGAQLASLLEQLTPNPPVGVIRTPYENEKPSEWLSGRLSIPQIMLPYTVGGREDVNDLFSLFDVSLRMLEERVP